MNAYLINYCWNRGGKSGDCFAVEYGSDVFAAVSKFMELRKLGQICGVRRMINGHHKSPVYL